MRRRAGRPARHYNVRVRAERRNPIDFDALARAALEQAAMDERNDTKPAIQHRHRKRPTTKQRAKEVRHDDLE